MVSAIAGRNNIIARTIATVAVIVVGIAVIAVIVTGTTVTVTVIAATVRNTEAELVLSLLSARRGNAANVESQDSLGLMGLKVAQGIRAQSEIPDPVVPPDFKAHLEDRQEHKVYKVPLEPPDLKVLREVRQGLLGRWGVKDCLASKGLLGTKERKVPQEIREWLERQEPPVIPVRLAPKAPKGILARMALLVQ